MKLKLFFASLLSILLLAGCATMGGSTATPEAQIKAGADSVTAATTLATVALRNDKISVAQAKDFSTVMHTASAALGKADVALVKCRADTRSTAATVPDPCQASTIAIIQAALDAVASVKAKLDAAK